MNLRPFLVLFLLLSVSSYGEGRRLPSPYFHIEKKLITNATELEALGFFGTDFHSQEYLDEMLSSFWEGLENNNYYLIFYKTHKNPVRKVSQIRSKKRILKGYIRVSKARGRCSTYQPLNHSVIKHGLGLTSALQGICGKIATLYSLENLGVIKNISQGKYIKEKMLSEVRPRRVINQGGMSSFEVALAHKKYTGKNCKFYRQVCRQEKRNNPPLSQEFFKKFTKKSLKVFIAKLYTQMNNPKTKYACSLGVISYDSKRKKKLSNIEYITKIAVNPNTKKAMIVTKLGLIQGDMKRTVPVNAGTNTFSIDPENLKCLFERSSHRAINTIYQGTNLDRIEATCCPL